MLTSRSIHSISKDKSIPAFATVFGAFIAIALIAIAGLILLLSSLLLDKHTLQSKADLMAIAVVRELVWGADNPCQIIYKLSAHNSEGLDIECRFEGGTDSYIEIKTYRSIYSMKVFEITARAHARSQLNDVN